MSTCSQFPLLSAMVILPGGSFVGFGSSFVGFRPRTSAAWFMVGTLAHILVLVWSCMRVGRVAGVILVVAMITIIPAWWQFCIALTVFSILASGGSVGLFFSSCASRNS